MKKEQEERAKIEAELKAKKDAEIKAENEKQAEIKRTLEAEKKALKAPDKEKMKTAIDNLKFTFPELKQPESISKAADIYTTFEKFKVWAKEQINTL